MATDKQSFYEKLTTLLKRNWFPVLLVLFLCVYPSIHNCFCSWFVGLGIYNAVSDLYDLITKSLWLNLLFIIIFFVIALHYLLRIIIDKDFRWDRALCFVALIVVLLFDSFETMKNGNIIEIIFVYPLIPFDLGQVDYRHLWLLLLFCLFLSCFIPIINRIVKVKNKSQTNSDPIGFFPEDKILVEDTNLYPYADKIIDRVLNTRLMNKSFAVGITGGWGSGKTTFLSTLKTRFKNKAEIVDFNPWMCQSPEQVTSDFFHSLREQLSQKHSRLAKPIKDYADVLNAVTINTPFDFLTKLGFLWPKDKSLQKQRDHLSMLFDKMKVPVVVFIDDLDRLESDEAFEVLRLIRNTGNLSNVVYVVAYDKEYLVSVLDKKQIKGPTAYLEKIFPVELHLPKVSEKVLMNTFIKSMKEMLPDEKTVGKQKLNKNNIEHLIKQLNEEQRPILRSFLNSYRSILNFSRRYIFTLDYLQNYYSNEIKFRDLLWLELLEMYDPQTYRLLYEDPEQLLSICDDKYVLKKKTEDNSDPQTVNYRYEMSLPKTQKLLAMLFVQDYDVHKELSMRYCDNYYKYFYLSVPEEKLSRKEFDKIFSEEDYQEVISEWIDNKKDFDSIYYRFESFDCDTHSIERTESYLRALLEYSTKIGIFSKYGIRKLLEQKRFKNDDHVTLNDTIKEWVESKINVEGNLLGISNVLNKLYNVSYYQQYHNAESPNISLLKNEIVEDLLIKIMNRFLSSHNNIDLKDFFNSSSDFGRLFKQCCVLKTYDEETDTGEWINFTFDIAVNYFLKQKKRYSAKEIKQMRDNMYPIKNITINDPDQEDIYYWDQDERRDEKMTSYFGSKYDQKLKNFIDNCSLNSSQEKINQNKKISKESTKTTEKKKQSKRKKNNKK